MLLFAATRMRRSSAMPSAAFAGSASAGAGCCAAAWWERSRAIAALGEGRVELQQRALEQAELRRDFALRQHLQRALHERHRLLDRLAIERLLALSALLLPSPALLSARRGQEVLVGHEL